MPKQAALALALSLAVLAGCKDKVRFWQPTGAPKKLSLADEKMFVLPVEIGLEQGDAAPLSAGLVGGFSSTFGSNAIQGQPLRSALEAAKLDQLPRLLVLGMVEGAFTSGDGNSFQGSYKEVPKLTGLLYGWLKQQNLPVRYVAAAFIQERALNFPYSIFAKKRLARVEVMGGIFDLQKQQAVVVVNYTQNVPRQGMAANMSTTGSKLGKLLLCPHQDAECEAAGLNTASRDDLHIWRNPDYQLASLASED
jgi:hypothetical protein